MQQAAPELKRTFLDFVDQKGYFGQIKAMLSRKPPDQRLVLSLDDLREFDSELAATFVKRPAEYLPAFEEALQEAVEQEDAAFAKQVNVSHFRIAVNGDFGAHRVTPRGLGGALLNQLACVEGIVTKCSLVRPKVLRSTHYCPATGKFTSKEYRDATSFSGVATGSAYPSKDEEGNVLQTEYGLCEYLDHQTISLQEMPERAPPGQLPRSVDVLLENDLVDSCKPGDRVLLSGVYRALPSKANSSGMFRTIVVGNHVRHLTKGASIGTFTSEDVKNCKALAKRKECLRLLSESLAPSIFGHSQEKVALLLMLLGGKEKNLENGTHLRGDINILMLGDPSTAKSQLLRFVLRVAPLAISTTGRGSSGVGLTAAVTQDDDTGDRRLEAGAMVLADRGVCCVDEFDKMTDNDRVAIHEVMEQQTVTISKAGIHASLNARCSVVAAANPVYGQYDPNQSPMKNIGLPDSLLSRFDLLFVILDRKDPASDRRISQHVIRSHRLRHRAPSQVGARTTTPDQNDQTTPMFVDPNAAGTGNAPPSAAESGEQLNVAFIKKYIHFAKTRCNPELSAAAAAHISNAYADLRAKARESNGRTLPVTTRTLETIIRLSSAHAKCHLHGQVTKEDAEAALRVLNYALFAEEHKATVGGSKGGDDNGPSADPAGESAHSETVGDAAPPADEISRDDPAGGHPAGEQQVEARREMVLSALRTVFTMHNEECSLTDLQTQLRASHPHQTFERHEIDAILAQLEEENVVMYREGQILRI
jgi:DNA replication licensing factor MCM3